MKTSKVNEFIECLVELTQTGKITWMFVDEYLDRNKNEYLSKFLSGTRIYNRKFNKKLHLNESLSLCAEINGGMIYLLVTEMRAKIKYELIPQPNTSGMLLVIHDSEECTTALKALYNIAKPLKRIERINPAEKFVDDIIKNIK